MSAEKPEDPGKRLRKIEDANPIATSSDEDVQRAFRRRGGAGRLDQQQIGVVRRVATRTTTVHDVADIAGEASQEVTPTR